MKNQHRLIDITLLLLIIIILSGASVLGYSQKNNRQINTNNNYPNIVFITIDTLRADHFPINGLDALKNDSIYFSNLIANGSWTAPNTATILTGLHPDVHEIKRNNFPKQDFTWLAEILHEQGFMTTAFSANRNVSKKYKMHQGFKDFTSPQKKLFRKDDDLDYPDISLLITEAKNWLDQKESTQPFFMYLHPMNVHGPYRTPNKTTDTFNYYDETMAGIMWEKKLDNRQQVSDAYLKDLNNQYNASIAYTDEQLTNFIQELKNQKLYDNSIIIVTADHGEELYEHEGFAHGYSLYQEIIDLPLLIKPPKNAPENIKNMINQEYNNYIQQLDILPTILNYLNISVPENLTGQNILDLDNYESRPIIITADWKERCKGKAILEWSYKLIYTETDYQDKKKFTELYNLEQDPEEKNNLIEIELDKKNELFNKLFPSNT